jgi:hypothetical protein
VYIGGRSMWPVRTFRPSWPDGPPEPGCFALWFDSSFPSFVLPRVLQGIVPKTWGWSITLLSWRLVCDSIHRSCVTEICLGYRPGSLRRIFTGSYSLPPPLSSRHLILQDYSKLSYSTTKYSGACRMDLPGPTTSVGTRTQWRSQEKKYSWGELLMAD